MCMAPPPSEAALFGVHGGDQGRSWSGLGVDVGVGRFGGGSRGDAAADGDDQARKMVADRAAPNVTHGVILRTYGP